MTLKDFIEHCKANPTIDVYEHCYDDDKLRDEIYAEGKRLGVWTDDTNEPFRASCYAIGVQHKVAALIEY